MRQLGRNSIFKILPTYAFLIKNSTALMQLSTFGRGRPQKAWKNKDPSLIPLIISKKFRKQHMIYNRRCLIINTTLLTKL